MADNDQRSCFLARSFHHKHPQNRLGTVLHSFCTTPTDMLVSLPVLVRVLLSDVPLHKTDRDYPARRTAFRPQGGQLSGFSRGRYRARPDEQHARPGGEVGGRVQDGGRGGGGLLDEAVRRALTVPDGQGADRHHRHRCGVQRLASSLLPGVVLCSLSGDYVCCASVERVYKHSGRAGKRQWISWPQPPLVLRRRCILLCIAVVSALSCFDHQSSLSLPGTVLCVVDLPCTAPVLSHSS